MRDRLKAILEARTSRPQTIAEAAARRPGLGIGRSLLFPPDDDGAGAVHTEVSMVRG